MKMGYFEEGRETIEKIDKDILSVRKVVLTSIGMAIALITFVFFLIALALAKDRSREITSDIVQLYETLQKIINQQKDNSGKSTAVLSFESRSEELDGLHLTFNNVAKTIILASSAMKRDED